MAGLDYPTPGLLVRIAFLLRCLALAADYMRDIAVGKNDFHGILTPIPGIGTQVLGATLFGCWALDHNGIEHGLNLCHVVCVGSGHDE